MIARVARKALRWQLKRGDHALAEQWNDVVIRGEVVPGRFATLVSNVRPRTAAHKVFDALHGGEKR